MTDHINRYPLDNRRCNLRSTSALENNRNRTNYYLHHKEETDSRIYLDPEKEAWNAHVETGEKILMKSFPIHEYGYEKAEEKANQWRRKTFYETEERPMTGVSFTGREWRAYIRIGNKMTMKTFPLTRYDYKTARQKAIEWRTEMAETTENHVSMPGEELANYHPEYDRLRTEFEYIMIQHAGGFMWKG